MCASTLLIAQSHAVDVGDITTDSEKSSTSTIAGLDYTESVSIGTINAHISGEVTDGHNAFGIKSNSGISIRRIGSDAVIGASASRNYAYAIYTSGGNISIADPMEGKLLVSVNTAYSAASANAYGIYTKSGNISLGGTSADSLISITTPQTGKSGRFFGIVTEAGDIDITGPLAGTIKTDAPGSISYGIWAKKGTVDIQSVAGTALLDIKSTFNAYGVYSSTSDISIGTFDGTMDIAATTGNFAYGVRASGLTDTDRSSVTMADINGRISVSSVGTDACGIQADYGFVTLGNVNGSIDVSATGDNAYGVSAKYDLAMGDIGSGAVISAESAGKDAYAIHAGYHPKASFDTVFINNLTVGHIDGRVTASAASGYAAALFARGDVMLDGTGEGSVISASSDASATALAIWAVSGEAATGRIDGAVSARSASGDAYGISGLGLDVEVGATGSITAEGARAYAMYSGCYQGSGFRTYNVEDRLTLHAGAAINGIVELGGSGATGYDQITLLGGTPDGEGVFDASVQTTINTTNQDGATQRSDVRLVLGDQAHWTVSNQGGLLAGLTVGDQAVVTSDDASLSVRDGGFIDNRGMIAGTGSIAITANSSLTTGHILIDAQTHELVTGSTGFGDGVSLSIEKGATLGTTILNDTESLQIIRQDDIREGVGRLFSELTGTSVNLDDYDYSYVLSGNIAFSDKLVVADGEQYRLGDGVNVVLAGGSVPDHSLVLEGGTVDATGTGEQAYTNRQISGTSGLLIGADDQVLRVVTDAQIGYSVKNAGIIVGGLQGEAVNAVLTGTYDTARVEVNSGTLELRGKDASLGSSDGQVDVAAGAALVNNGTVLAAVKVGDGAELKGSGVFANDVALGSHAALHVGNSPGYQLYQGNLSPGHGASLVFYLDGTTQASPDYSGSGTHSHITVSGAGNTISLGGANTINLNIGAGVLAGDSAGFSLELISYVDGAAADASFNEGNVTTVLSGLTDLVEPGVTYSFLGDALVVHGRVNRDAAEETVSHEAAKYANALWSSTGIVRSFARTSFSHLDFGQAGKTNFWVDGIGDFMTVSNDGRADGFESNQGGYAFGAERKFNKAWSGGLAYGQSYGRNTSRDDFSRIKQTANMLGVYARYERDAGRKNGFHVDASFAYGQVENKADGYFNNSLDTPASAEWDDNVFSFSMIANWTIRLGERSLITPFTGIEYVNGSQESYDQFAGDARNRYSGGALQRWIIPVGVTWQGVYSVGTQYLIPEVTVAYQGDVSRRDPSVRTSVLGQETKFQGCRPARSAVIANAGLRWVINGQWSTSAYYNLNYSSGMTHHSVNAGATYSF